MRYYVCPAARYTDLMSGGAPDPKDPKFDLLGNAIAYARSIKGCCVYDSLNKVVIWR